MKLQLRKNISKQYSETEITAQSRGEISPTSKPQIIPLISSSPGLLTFPFHYHYGAFLPVLGPSVAYWKGLWSYLPTFHMDRKLFTLWKWLEPAGGMRLLLQSSYDFPLT